MKLQTILTYISLFFSITGYAQDINGIAVYKYKFPLKDTLTATLFFDNNGESYYIAKNKIRIFQSSQSNNEEFTPLVREKYDSSFVFRNILTKEHLYSEGIFSKGYIVTDTLRKIKWELLPETKKIGNFNCASAKTRFGGRNYQVWYTPEIPINTGPWKLYGLPGLIVEVADDAQLIYYVLASLEINKEKKDKSLDIKKIREVAISKEAFKKQEKLADERAKAFGQSHGAKITIKRQRLELEDN